MAVLPTGAFARLFAEIGRNPKPVGS